MNTKEKEMSSIVSVSALKNLYAAGSNFIELIESRENLKALWDSGFLPNQSLSAFGSNHPGRVIKDRLENNHE